MATDAFVAWLKQREQCSFIRPARCPSASKFMPRLAKDQYLKEGMQEGDVCLEMALTPDTIEKVGRFLDLQLEIVVLRRTPTVSRKASLVSKAPPVRGKSSLTQVYRWGQNDYLPNFYSRRIILGNFLCFYVNEREVLGELILTSLAKITLPKSVAKSIGNVLSLMVSKEAQLQAGTSNCKRRSCLQALQTSRKEEESWQEWTNTMRSEE